MQSSSCWLVVGSLGERAVEWKHFNLKVGSTKKVKVSQVFFKRRAFGQNGMNRIFVFLSESSYNLLLYILPPNTTTLYDTARKNLHIYVPYNLFLHR
jgi:hypothetical protein